MAFLYGFFGEQAKESPEQDHDQSSNP
jgi:hypothetical protein